jgi:hypothetical protein
MLELERQSSSKKAEIEFGDQIYTIKNPRRSNITKFVCNCFVIKFIFFNCADIHYYFIHI